jgi:hypothetical protein
MKKLNSHILTYIVVTVLFFILVLALPANKVVMSEYSISPVEYHVLLFSVELPLAAIWFAAFYCSSILRKYALTIKKTSEGDGYTSLARGVKWLAWGLAIPSVISLIMNAIANSRPNFHPTAIIIANYMSLFFPLVAFNMIGSGAHALTIGKRLHTSIGARAVMLVFAVLSAFYCYFTFSHLTPHHLTSSTNPYFLAGWIQIITISIPILFAWFIGIMAAYDISLFAKNTRGILYRRPLEYVASGLIVVVISSILQQYLHTVTPRVGHLSLNTTLVVVYLIYAVMSAGFFLIITGANKLRRIEEI